MILLFCRPLLALFALLSAAAVLCGVTASTLDLDVPIWAMLACCAALGWLIEFVPAFFEPKGNMVDLKARLKNGAGQGKAGLFFAFPAIVLTAAPAFFILTGAWLTSLAIGCAALVASLIFPPVSGP